MFREIEIDGVIKWVEYMSFKKIFRFFFWNCFFTYTITLTSASNSWIAAFVMFLFRSFLIATSVPLHVPLNTCCLNTKEMNYSLFQRLFICVRWWRNLCLGTKHTMNDKGFYLKKWFFSFFFFENTNLPKSTRSQ